MYRNYKYRNFFLHVYDYFFKKEGTVLRGLLAYPNGLLDLYIETLGRTPWPGDQPDAMFMIITRPNVGVKVSLNAHDVKYFERLYYWAIV
jgi:hypothetical protein